MLTLNDKSPMPFGMHKGTPMGEVPASYLLHLWDNGVHKESTALAKYISNVFNCLESECQDYIVQHPPK